MDNDQKRVLYVITKATWGGAQRYVLDLMRHAREYGYRPALAFGERGLLSEKCAADGFETFRIPGLARDISFPNEVAALFELALLFRSFHPEIVHLNSSKAGFTGALAAFISRGGMSGGSWRAPRVIFTAHGWAFNETRSIFSKQFFRFFHFCTVRLSDATIAVSDSVYAPVRSWQSRRHLITVVKLGIEPPALLEREQARAELMSLEPSLARARQALWVGTIAELHPNKGIDIGIEGWHRAELRNAEWILIGDGEERRALSAKSGTGLHLLGFLPDAARYLKAFDLFLAPSRTEALGYAILEAGSAGVPVLGSDAGGIPEAVGNAEMLFPTGDADALARKLASLVARPEALPAEGRRLCERVRDRFGMTRMISETFALYRSGRPGG